MQTKKVEEESEKEMINLLKEDIKLLRQKLLSKVNTRKTKEMTETEYKRSIRNVKSNLNEKVKILELLNVSKELTRL